MVLLQVYDPLHREATQQSAIETPDNGGSPTKQARPPILQDVSGPVWQPNVIAISFFNFVKKYDGKIAKVCRNYLPEFSASAILLLFSQKPLNFGLILD